MKNLSKKFIFFGILIIAILSISLIMAAITNITLISPAHNSWTNDNTPDFTFNAQSSLVNPFNCSLYIDNTYHTSNDSVISGENTILNPASDLSDGSHDWYISCVDSDLKPKNSTTWTINIDTGDPVVTLLDPPDDYTTQLRSIDFEFRATDNYDLHIECSLYIDDVEEDHMTVYSGDVEIFEVDYISRGIHDWYITCEDEAGNIGHSETRDFEIEEIGYCKYGELGTYLEISIEEPDFDDEFYVGEEIEVEVEVENDYTKDLDIVIKAQLYNLDDEDDESEEKLEVEIDEGETETYTLNLKIPSSVDESDDFVVNVKVYEDGEEDEQCSEDSVDITIERKNHEIIIDKLSINPTTVECDANFNLNLEIENVGENDEDVQIKIFNSDLSIEFEKEIPLDEGDDYVLNQVFSVPKDIQEGNYIINVEVNYNEYSGSYHDYTEDKITLKVEGNCLPAAEKDVSFTLSQIGDVFVGNDFLTKVVITNTGNVETTYSIEIENYQHWATLTSINPRTITLYKGETGYVYITLKPTENAGDINSFTVQVSFDSITEEQQISVQIRKETEAAAAWSQFLFELKRNWYWAFLNLFLFVIIIILIIHLIIQRGRARRIASERAERAQARLRLKVKRKKKR